MDASSGLIPHPSFGTSPRIAAGSAGVPCEQPALTHLDAYRHSASSAYSMMLTLLETLRNLMVSGHEPAPFLIAIRQNGSILLVLGRESVSHIPSLALAFLVSARRLAGGMLLEVRETGGSGYILDQFCRLTAAGSYEPLPHCWRQPILAKASSAYQSTSGLIPYWGFRNSSLLNHLIC